jgi:hypothetical protein
MKFFTIGVYNSTEIEFFNKLTDNNIDTFCDIRQRRGVRGSKYAFVNSNRLQKKLSELGIYYQHELDLAPTQEIRDLQKKTDAINHELKSERRVLGNTFRLEYQKRVLDKFNFGSFFEKLESRNASGIVLFCVEEFPEACHRSLVSEKLEGDYHFTIKNL